MNCSPFYLTALALGVGHWRQSDNSGQGRRASLQKDLSQKAGAQRGTQPHGNLACLHPLVLQHMRREKQDKGRPGLRLRTSTQDQSRGFGPGLPFAGL